MAKIRAFSPGDVSQVAALYLKVFQLQEPHDPRLLQHRFAHVYFENPWNDAQLPSLVYEEDSGKISGFLGVMPRCFSFRGRQIRAAVSSNFMVEESLRHFLIAVQLLKKFFEGPQDLSI